MILISILILTGRHHTQIAALLGYASWAAYVQQVDMAKSPARVASFLGGLEGRLAEVPLRALACFLLHCARRCAATSVLV